MTAEAEQIRQLARSVRALAQRSRATEDALRRAQGVRWRSDGAAAYRTQLSGYARDLKRRSDDLDELYRSLLRHADGVERAQSIADTFKKGFTSTVTGIVRDPLETMGRVGDRVLW